MRLPSALFPLQPLVFSPGLWLKGAVHSRLAKKWLQSVGIEGFCPVQANQVLDLRLDPQIYNFMVKNHSVFAYCGVRKEHQEQGLPQAERWIDRISTARNSIRIKSILKKCFLKIRGDPCCFCQSCRHVLCDYKSVCSSQVVVFFLVLAVWGTVVPALTKH